MQDFQKLYKAMILSLILSALFLSTVEGQFHKACTTKEALANRRCCPIGEDGTECGAGSGRGLCGPVYLSTTQQMSTTMESDDRVNWPHGYYDSVCSCNFPYDGAGCEFCKCGYSGDKCQTRTTVVRRDIRSLSLLELKRLLSYMCLAKHTKSDSCVILTTGNRYNRTTFSFQEASIYDCLASMHNYVAAPILQNDAFTSGNFFIHGGSAFIPWHRWFLRYFECSMQRLTSDYNFFLPYYDWRKENNTCSICKSGFLGESDTEGKIDSRSLFGDWGCVCSGYNYEEKYCKSGANQCQLEQLHRNPGSHAWFKSLPTVLDVRNTLKWKSYDTSPFDSTSWDSFRNVLEGFRNPANGRSAGVYMHNVVHMFMQGVMSRVDKASCDFIFYLHHCFIDMISECFIRMNNITSANYPNNARIGMGPMENMIPSLPPVKNKDYLTNSLNLFYTYDNLQDVCNS